MSCCAHCADSEDLFSRRAARRDLRRYRRRGANPATRRLIALVKLNGVADRTLLDVGGGVGAIQHELLRAGAARALHVDASTAYLHASEEEAVRQGHRERVEYHYGDVVDLAADLPEADIVTLDRVVCCYPDMPRLIEQSAARARHLYALTYPRLRWGTRAVLGAGNLMLRLRGSAFRSYLHAPSAIDAQLRRQGMRSIAEDHTVFWHVSLYGRVGHAARSSARPGSRA